MGFIQKQVDLGLHFKEIGFCHKNITAPVLECSQGFFTSEMFLASLFMEDFASSLKIFKNLFQSLGIGIHSKFFSL